MNFRTRILPNQDAYNFSHIPSQCTCSCTVPCRPHFQCQTYIPVPHEFKRTIICQPRRPFTLFHYLSRSCSVWVRLCCRFRIIFALLPVSYPTLIRSASAFAFAFAFASHRCPSHRSMQEIRIASSLPRPPSPASPRPPTSLTHASSSSGDPHSQAIMAYCDFDPDPLGFGLRT